MVKTLEEMLAKVNGVIGWKVSIKEEKNHKNKLYY